MRESLTYETGLREECGVFGMFDLEGGDVARDMYYGLSALQHRGQESCGIAVCDTNGPKGVARRRHIMKLPVDQLCTLPVGQIPVIF